MAFSRVQGNHSFANSGTHGVNITGVTAGNTLVLNLAIFNPTTTTILVDSALQTWILHSSRYGSGDGVEQWVLVNASAGAHTLALSTFGDAINEDWDEWTSGTTPHVVDKTNDNLTNNPTTLSSGATGTLSTSVQVAIAVMTHNGGAPSIGVDTSDGWTDRWTDTDNNNHQCISVADKILSSSLSLAHTWTIGTPTPGEGLACILTLMEDSGPPAAPDYFSAIYPDSFERVDENLESFIVTAFLPRLDFFSAVYPDKIFRRRRLPLEEFELISPPEFDGYFGAVYPDSIKSREDIIESQITTPIIISAPIVVTYFGTIYPDTVDRIRDILESQVITPTVIIPTHAKAIYPDSLESIKDRLDSGIIGPVFTPVAPPLAGKNWEVIAPDILFRRKDYSDFPFISELRQTITIPGAASNLSLIWFYNLRVRLDVKKAVDSGNALADSTDVSGTEVFFNKPFKDIDSLTATVQETAEFTVVIDFVDIPNPTSFFVFVFDAAGARATKTIYWKARGII